MSYSIKVDISYSFGDELIQRSSWQTSFGHYDALSETLGSAVGSAIVGILANHTDADTAEMLAEITDALQSASSSPEPPSGHG
jgi:hypothetical protein